MAKKVKRGQRTIGEKLRNPVARGAAKVTGSRVGKQAPGNFPKSGGPRVKPKGSTRKPKKGGYRK